MICSIKIEELERWLEWAGQRLIAMPGPKIGPSDLTVIWPDFSQDKWEIIKFRSRIALRVVAPNKDEIGLMEEILLLPNLIGLIENERDASVRMIVRRRTLLHPITDRHLWNWSRLAEKHRIKPPTARNRYYEGLGRICRQLSDKQTKSIRDEFDFRVLAL